MMIERGTGNAQMKRWDTGTLQWVAWDGSLTAGSLTIGQVTDAGSGKTLKTAVINRGTTGSVVAAVGGRRIKVYSYKMVCDAALTVNWRSGSSTALEGPCAFAANGGVTENVNPPNYVFQTAVGESLELVISGTGNVGGVVRYWDDDAA